jgi:glycosyltransferase involved in cell wall biosynthesis
MSKTPLSILAGLATARHFLREFHPDLLHSHSFHSNICARLLKLLLPSVKVVSTVHNVYEGGWSRMQAYRLTDPLAFRTTAVSQAAADRFVRLKAVPKRKCQILTNGIDIGEFAPSASQRALARAAMNAGSNFIWLAAGRLIPAKDYPNLLLAFRQVRQAAPNAQLWIAGAPKDAALPQSDNIARFVSALDVDRDCLEQVRWLGLRRDMPALLNVADAFVSSSAWEGLPLAVAEAMAMEKPVVATDAGGTRELVGDVGRIVPSKNPDALAAAMLHLMRQPTDFHVLGIAARSRIASHFSMETKADEWHALYQSIIGARP